MANVLFTRTSDPSSKPITDGQLIFDTSGNGKMYLDVGDKRLEMGGAINIDSTLDPTSENPIQNKAVAGVMLSTLKEIDKVTSKGKLTDALATKELNTKVTDLETDVSSLTDDYVSKGKILGSLEEVTTATNAGFVPDALAIKELDTDLQGQIDTLNSDFTWKKADNFATAFNNAKSEVLITVYFSISDIRHAVELIIPKYNVKDARYVTGSPYSTSSLVYVQFEKVGTNLTIQVFLNSVNLAFTTDILYR